MNNRSAFSLVELSIVLVILGLITGGILTGQSLIRAAELRSFATQYQTFQTSVMTFRDKYFALPGDMRNATAFWGPTAACPGTAGTGTQTCDGDGDGSISTGAASQYGERFTFWQHLANAGLIEGTYTGIAGVGGNQDSVPGENAPLAKVEQALWFADTKATGGNPARYYEINYQNYFMVGIDTGSSNRPHNPIVTPEELWNLDKKLDDGRPGHGIIIAGQYDECTNSVDENAIDGEYLFTEAGKVCNILFSRAF